MDSKEKELRARTTYIIHKEDCALLAADTTGVCFSCGEPARAGAEWKERSQQTDELSTLIAKMAAAEAALAQAQSKHPDWECAAELASLKDENVRLRGELTQEQERERELAAAFHEGTLDLIKQYRGALLPEQQAAAAEEIGRRWYEGGPRNEEVAATVLAIMQKHATKGKQ